MNRNNKLNCERARSYDLVDYLANLDFSPAKIVRNQYWYLSPLRAENTPSFKVNRTINRWMDFGDGRGGNLIDFAILYHRCTVGEFLQILDARPTVVSSFKPDDTRAHSSEAGKIIILHQETLSEVSLLNYLRQRRIALIFAFTYCKEVTFELYGKTTRVIGFANDAGGYELRSLLFKGSSSPKTFTTLLTGTGNVLCVFEGFFDFLSYLTLMPPEQISGQDFLILNSLVFFEKARLLMESFEEVRLFLDNNKAGQRVTAYALSLSSCYRDQSKLYDRYQDLNDYLVYFGKPPQ
jgi:hypothetical protein